MKAYCLKCRKTTEMKNTKQIKLKKNNRPAVRGACSECGSLLFRMGKLQPEAEPGDG